MTNVKWLAVLCAGALFAGCSAQGAGTLPASGGSDTARFHSHKGTVVLRIKVPKVRHFRAGRAPRYVSPATQSMTVSIAGPTNVTQTVNLTSTSKGCTSTLTSTLCRLTMTLKPGSYTGTITTFDAVNGGGNALSKAQSVAFSVNAGTSNAIALTLSGIPHSIVVVPGSAYSRTSAGGDIQLFGTAANKLAVEALDADGNAIVGPGSPTFVIGNAFGNLGVTLTQPAVAQPNVFTVTPPSTYSGQTATLSVQAVYNSGLTDGCAQPGANCFGNAKVAMEQLGAVATGSGFSVFETTGAAPFATVSGLAGANAVAFDPAGNLYVSGTSGVSVYAPPYSVPTGTIVSGIAAPSALHFDASGNLFVANCPTCAGSGTDSVVEFAAPVSTASVAALAITNGIAHPSAITDDGAGNVFVANATGNSGTGSVTEYAAGSGTPAVTVTNTVAAPNALAYDSVTTSLFVSNATASVNVYTFPFSGAPTVLPTASGGGACGVATIIDHPVALALHDTGGGSRRIFVANSSAGTVNAVTSFNANPAFNCRGVFDTGGNPAALIVDGTSSLFVANNSANTVIGYSPLSAPSAFTTIPITSPVGLAIVP